MRLCIDLTLRSSAERPHAHRCRQRGLNVKGVLSDWLVPHWIAATQPPFACPLFGLHPIQLAPTTPIEFNPFSVCNFRRHPYTFIFSIVAGRNQRVSDRMEGFGLPMSFGKKAKAGTVNMKAKLEKTRRDEVGMVSLPQTASQILCLHLPGGP